MASKQSKLELDSVITDGITLLTLKQHYDIITNLIDDEAKVLEMSDAELGNNIKIALAFDIAIKYFGG